MMLITLSDSIKMADKDIYVAHLTHECIFLQITQNVPQILLTSEGTQRYKCASRVGRTRVKFDHNIK
jgi:hypothetical protein